MAFSFTVSEQRASCIACSRDGYVAAAPRLPGRESRPGVPPGPPSRRRDSRLAAPSSAAARREAPAAPTGLSTTLSSGAAKEKEELNFFLDACLAALQPRILFVG
jgi:hypothetical protein